MEKDGQVATQTMVWPRRQLPGLLHLALLTLTVA